MGQTVLSETVSLILRMVHEGEYPGVGLGDLVIHSTYARPVLFLRKTAWRGRSGTAWPCMFSKARPTWCRTRCPGRWYAVADPCGLQVYLDGRNLVVGIKGVRAVGAYQD